MLGISTISRFQASKLFYLLHNKPTSPWVGHSPIQTLPGAVSPGVKLSRHEAHHSAPFSADVKSEWSYATTSLYAFVACKATSFLVHTVGKQPAGLWRANVSCQRLWVGFRKHHIL